MVHADEFKLAVGKFPSGVCVIATSVNGSLYGFTANSFVSVSLEPSLISFCLVKTASSFNAFNTCEFFSVNILAHDQQNIARHFSLRLPDKFIDVNYDISLLSNTPLLTGAISYIECKIFNKIECGDHFIFVGEVVRTTVDESKSPLVYYAKSYREIT